MIKQHLLGLGLVVGLCVPLQAFAKHSDGFSETDKNVAPPNRREATTNKAATSTDTTVISNLVADGFTTYEKMMAEKERYSKTKAIAELAEKLEYPAIDLYGGNSWGEYVNPYAGSRNTVGVPETYDIDCNGFVMPLDGKTRVTSHYGYRRRYGRMHRGIDLKLSIGDTVRAAFDGKVRISDYEGRGYGHYIVIRHDNGLETVYGHLSRKLAVRNDIVKAGEPIGLGGSTGRSTGPHLHFEARFMGIALNPAQLFDFEDGVPLKDSYTFKRNGKSARSSAQYADGSGKKGKTTKQAPSVYRIRKGDNLSAIAQRMGVSVNKICQLNNMSSKAILRPGQTLRIR